MSIGSPRVRQSRYPRPLRTPPTPAGGAVECGTPGGTCAPPCTPPCTLPCGAHTQHPASVARAASVRRAERLRAMSAGHAEQCTPRHRPDRDMHPPPALTEQLT